MTCHAGDPSRSRRGGRGGRSYDRCSVSSTSLPRLSRNKLGRTERRDPWWVPPVAVAAGLAVFGVYALVVAILGDDYRYEGRGADYLSPFYSPDLESLFG